MYLNTNVQADTYDFGAYSSPNGIFGSARQMDGKFYSGANDASIGWTTASSIGYFSGSSVGSLHEQYKNGTSLGSGANADGRVAYDIHIGCVNNAGSDALHSTRRFATLIFASGLTDAEDTDIYNAVLTFNTALGRN